MEDIEETVDNFNFKHITVTGGEPLAQKTCLKLLSNLCDKQYEGTNYIYRYFLIHICARYSIGEKIAYKQQQIRKTIRITQADEGKGSRMSVNCIACPEVYGVK